MRPRTPFFECISAENHIDPDGTYDDRRIFAPRRTGSLVQPSGPAGFYGRPTPGEASADKLSDCPFAAPDVCCMLICLSIHAISRLTIFFC